MESERHPHFPSGEWEGHYTYGPGSEKHPMAFRLNFAEGSVSGAGSDDVGPFTWNGHYDTQSLVVQMVKKYRGAHEVYYDGRADTNGIYGGWRLIFSRGGFHIWPKALGEEFVTEEVTEEVGAITGADSWSGLLSPR
ncbi:MAG: hypothetical protein AAFZ52_05760 [Bacteroidota bacterium]